MPLKHLSKAQFLQLLSFTVLLLVLSGCAQLPNNSKKESSYAIADNVHSQLANDVQVSKSKHNVSPSKSGVMPLADGIDAFVARVAMAKIAEKTLDVQYYLYHSDLTGTLFTAALWQAAERGVRVRILLDDMDMGDRDRALAVLNGHKNIQIRLFNPFIRGKFRTPQFVTRFGSVTRRSHNKSMIADNQLAVLGGRNIGDEYFAADPNLSFGDLDVLVTQPATNEVSKQFDLYWNSPLAYPVESLIGHHPTEKDLRAIEGYIQSFYKENTSTQYIERLKQSPLLNKESKQNTDYFWGKTDVIYDLPEKISANRDETHLHLSPQLAPYFKAAEKELLVVSPYFVPGKEGVEFFRTLQEKGVQVKILTNSLTSNDVPIVHVGYARYRKDLLAAGVKLYELDKTTLGPNDQREKSRTTREGVSGSKASLHAKYFVIDNKYTFIGSLNLDPRSVIENTEVGVVIHQDKLASLLHATFDTQILKHAFELQLVNKKLVWRKHQPNGQVKEYYSEPYSSFWDKISQFFMSLLPIESQI